MQMEPATAGRAYARTLATRQLTTRMQVTNKMESKNTAGCPSEEILCGYADGTLRERRDDIEAHLATCERCFSLVADLIVSARQMSGAVLDPPPIGLERQVQGRGLTEESPSWAASLLQRMAGALFTYRAAGALATVSIVALAIIWVGQRDHRPGEDPARVRSAAPRMWMTSVCSSKSR